MKNEGKKLHFTTNYQNYKPSIRFKKNSMYSHVCMNVSRDQFEASDRFAVNEAVKAGKFGQLDLV